MVVHRVKLLLPVLLFPLHSCLYCLSFCFEYGMLLISDDRSPFVSAFDVVDSGYTRLRTEIDLSRRFCHAVHGVPVFAID